MTIKQIYVYIYDFILVALLIKINISGTVNSRRHCACLRIRWVFTATKVTRFKGFEHFCVKLHIGDDFDTHCATDISLSEYGSDFLIYVEVKNKLMMTVIQILFW